MQPGLARAVPLGIVGFVIGATIAYLIRLAQGLEPNAAAPYGFVGSAMVLGAFISAGFFVWGMGAFDPRMNVHGEHAAEEHHEPEPEEPRQILVGYTWQILLWTILLVVAVAAFAFIPSGPQLRSIQGDGDPAAIGATTFDQIYNPIREFAKTAAGIQMPALADNIAAIQISYLLLLVLTVLWTIISLFVVSGLLASTFTYLSAARTQAERTHVPWRAIVLVLLIGGLINFPIIAPNLQVPMAFIVPAYLLPPLLFFIAYRQSYGFALFCLVLVLIGMALPILVPVVNLAGVWIIYNLLLTFIIEILFFRALKFLVSDSLWRRIVTIVYGVTILGAYILSVATAWPDFWQIIFLLVVETAVFMLIVPVEFLKALVPRGIWEHFAAVQWTRVVPQFAGWVAGLLRTGLPRLLGQR
jgi:hypothetical protein